MNTFWGKHYGTNHPLLGLIFKGKRGNAKSSGNSGPAGKSKTRWYQGRFGRKGKLAVRSKT